MKKKKEPRLYIAATKMLEFISVVIGGLSLIMFTIFVFCHFGDKRAYNNNLSLSKQLHMDPPAEPYDYSMLIVGMLIILCVSLLIIAVCELSRNVYYIGKITMKQEEEKEVNTTDAQPDPLAVTDTYCCPACGTINKFPSRFCSGCGKQIM